MNVIILAGGMGTRLRDIVSDVPKPMAPVGGRPFLEHLISQLRCWGHRDIVLSVGYLKDAITDYFQDGKEWDVSIRYSEEDNPLGTGGAVKKALALIPEDECIVMNGDSFFDLDFGEFVGLHKNKRGDATIALTHLPDVSRYGSVVMNNEGRIVSFRERGENGEGSINCGIYIFQKRPFEAHPSESFSLERDILTELSHDALFGFVQEGTFIDIGIPEDYMAAQELFSHKIVPSISRPKIAEGY